MKAILITLCGCQREFEITFPPTREIMIPLNKDEYKVGWLSVKPRDPDDVFKTRTFKISEPIPYSPSQIAYYIED